MKRIRLSNADVKAMVSDCDYEAVSRYSWFLKPSAYHMYVVASVREGHKVRTLRLHRVIAERMGILRDGERLEVHHIDGDCLNCTRENLQALTPSIHGVISRQYQLGESYVPF